ncbi:succinyl-diaminopimelate desuccinylase [Acetobacteraceae bacterium KSS8]|uniref:Succinyl-diaminopimelate desuccinylase n=1 Tax=Endosaccharibacter trunci TaxID=2812733 RepID=A0ABT1W9P7_9PROT|nr:succinyl-diaminopimelate desuccinylase [Acetobacteraceae bacterium KSS8]
MKEAAAAVPQTVDPSHALRLARRLIECRSVTPEDGGAQAVLAGELERLGFTVTLLPFGTTPNLFARIGTGAPHLCFAGHTDVVPPGDAAWTVDPFAAEERDGVLFGRGACDMKGAIACFVAAAADRLAFGPLHGSLSLLITGDEEGPATDGTVRVLDWMSDRGQIPDFCLVGEPTNPSAIGDCIKIGRRGSLNARIEVRGVQGHVAYPHRADNPVHRLLRILGELTASPLDEGSDSFEPSSLQVTSVDVGNPASNVIPSRAVALLNIRFNDRHSGASLSEMLQRVCDAHAPGAALDIRISGESFLCEPGREIGALRSAVRAVTGREPSLDTGGGTSDARFIARFCPVAEFGLVGASMHKADENVPLSDLAALTRIYRALIGQLMPEPGGETTP